MDISEEQLQSAISKAIERMDTLEWLKMKARLSGMNAATTGAREFVKLGSRALVESVSKRKPVPRKWVETQAKRQRMQCADCERELRLETVFSDRDEYACWDHVVPLNNGGEHSRRNGRVICRSCNSRKGDSEPLRFSRHTGHLMTNLTVETEPEAAT